MKVAKGNYFSHVPPAAKMIMDPFLEHLHISQVFLSLVQQQCITSVCVGVLTFSHCHHASFRCLKQCSPLTDVICCTDEGGVMIPNTLLLNQNTKVINFILKNETEFNNLLHSYFLKKEVTNTAQFVAVFACS